MADQPDVPQHEPVVVFESAVEQAGSTAIPNGVLLNPAVTPEAKAVYALLRYLAGDRVGGDLSPARAQIGAALGMSVKRVRTALQELTEAVPPLVADRRRGQGRTNLLVVLDLNRGGVETDRSRVAEKDIQESPKRPVPARARDTAGLGLGSDSLEIRDKEQRQKQTHARVEPPEVAVTEGRVNPALDALLSACGIDPKSPRVKAAVVALNGRAHKTSGKIIQPGIRQLFWIECVRWAEEHDALDRLDLAYEQPLEWAGALARRIGEKVTRYMDTYPGAALSPQALRDHWLDLDRAPHLRDQGLSPDEIERLP